MSISNLFEQYESYRKAAPFQGFPNSLYQPMQYIMELGGKRTRPLLVLSSCLSSGGQGDIAMPVAHAMEVFHNFTLLHDDIMDNASTRRGQATVHEKWNTPTGILAGDNLLVSAYEVLLSYNGPHRDEILIIFSTTAKEVCEGQQLDMDFAQLEDVSETQYLRMIQLKTAVLLGCCAYAGALAGGHGPVKAQPYYDFALNLGLAFQLHDDWLDTFGDSAKTGKKAGGDIAEGKKTWLYTAAKHRELPVTEIYLNDNLEKRIALATQLFKQHGLDVELAKLSAHYADKASDILQNLAESGEHTSYLADLVEMLGARQH